MLIIGFLWASALSLSFPLTATWLSRKFNCNCILAHHQPRFTYYYLCNTMALHDDEANIAAPRQSGPKGPGAPGQDRDAAVRQSSKRITNCASADSGVSAQPASVRLCPGSGIQQMA